MWTPIPDDVSLLPVIRALLRCSNKVELAAARHLETLDLTPARFDVLSALGDNAGLTVKELCDVTLISKGTVLPVVSALEKLGWVQRCKHPQDSRQTIVSLTPAGQAHYEKTFLVHVEHMRGFLVGLSEADSAALVALLAKVEALF